MKDHRNIEARIAMNAARHLTLSWDGKVLHVTLTSGSETEHYQITDRKTLTALSLLGVQMFRSLDIGHSARE